MLTKIVWFVAMTGAMVAALSMGDVGAGEKKLLLWPYPHQITFGEGTFDVSGKSVSIPAAANEKSKAIADVLSMRLAKLLKLSAPPKVKLGGAPGTARYVLSIGAGPDAWRVAEKKLILDKAHPTLHEQAYVLDITPQGAVIVSPGSWGLFYGTVTLMQLARTEAQGSKIPCLSILDWPSLEVRGVHITRASDAHRKLAGSYAMDGKVNMIVWENFMSAFSWRTHPEVASGKGRFASNSKTYGKVVQEVRAMGVEVVPLRNMSLGHAKQSGLYPYVFLGDNETFYWAVKEMIDDELEVFTPRYFHIGLDEERYVTKLQYTSRNVTAWRDTAVECMKHLRRRGVMGMIWTEILFPQWGGKSKDYDWQGCLGGKFPSGYEKFAATFPNDLAFVPWFYWTKKPEDTLDGKGDVRRQAKTGHPIIVGAYETHILDHIEAVRMIKKDQPNVLGVLTTAWSGRALYQDKFPRHPEYVRRAMGPFWNRDVPSTWPGKGKAEIPTPFWKDGTDRHEKFTWPDADVGVSTLRCLFDVDPPKSIEEALAKISSPDWRIWTHAREQLVAAGFPAAPALLAAMSKATGENRERIEGCMSRNARDSRTGRKRGALDVAKVLPFLRDKNETVRDIAAETLVSFGGDGLAKARGMIKDAQAGAACIRALCVSRDAKSAADFTAIAANANAPARSRTEAARSLGILRIKNSGAALQSCLKQGTDKELQKAAIWSLALINCSAAEKGIAAFLESKDDDTRFRAAIALTLLKSSETKKLVPWLSKDRHSLELAAWMMWKTWSPKDAEKAFKAAVSSQSNATSKKRLENLSKAIVGKGDKDWRH